VGVCSGDEDVVGGVVSGFRSWEFGFEKVQSELTGFVGCETCLTRSCDVELVGGLKKESRGGMIKQSPHVFVFVSL
jgi:hypothetical protein